MTIYTDDASIDVRLIFLVGFDALSRGIRAPFDRNKINSADPTIPFEKDFANLAKVNSTTSGKHIPPLL